MPEAIPTQLQAHAAIVHDLRPQNEVKTPAWRRCANRRWRRYPTHTEAVRAACRAIKNHTPLPESTTDYCLAR